MRRALILLSRIAKPDGRGPRCSRANCALPIQKLSNSSRSKRVAGFHELRMFCVLTCVLKHFFLFSAVP